MKPQDTRKTRKANKITTRDGRKISFHARNPRKGIEKTTAWLLDQIRCPVHENTDQQSFSEVLAIHNSYIDKLIAQADALGNL